MDELPEAVDRLDTHDHSASHAPMGRKPTNDKGGRARETCRSRLGLVRLHGREGLWRIQTRPESVQADAEAFRKGRKPRRIQLACVGKQRAPVPPIGLRVLLTDATSGGSGRGRVGVNRQGKVANEVLDQARDNIIALQYWKNGAIVASAEGALVVDKFDDGNGRGGRAGPDGGAGGDRRVGRSGSGRAALEGSAQVGQGDRKGIDARVEGGDLALGSQEGTGEERHER